MYVIMVYDVCQNDNGRKRWAHISHIQDSVFEGELSNVQLTKMQKELEPYIDETQDSVIIFKSRQQRWLDKEFWGKKEDLTSFML